MNSDCINKIRNDVLKIKPKSIEDKMIKDNINFILLIMSRRYWIDDSIAEDMFNSLYVGLRKYLKKYNNKYKITTFMGKYVPYILNRALSYQLIPVTGLKRLSFKKAFDTINMQSMDEILDDKIDFEPSVDYSDDVDTSIDARMLVPTIERVLRKKYIDLDKYLYRVDKYSMEDLQKIYSDVPYTTLYQRRKRMLSTIRKQLTTGVV